MNNTEINDGGPAFPVVHAIVSQPGHFVTAPPAIYGMSLRDWFAGQALASMTIAPDYSKGPCNSAMAQRAYLIADAMLVEHNRKE